MLITDLNNVRFLTSVVNVGQSASGKLTGFTGTNGMVLITRRRAYFLTDSRYTEQAKKQIRGFEIVEIDRGLVTSITQILSKNRIKRLGLEAHHLSHAKFLNYKKLFKGVSIIPLTHDPADIRTIKHPAEISNIKKAHAINARAFKKLRPFIKPGVTEISIARQLEIAMLEYGAEKIAFDTIVASGWRGAHPHGVASAKKLKAGELVTIDFGCIVNGYNSDETVTLCLGKPSAKQKEIWQTVYHAQQAALKLAKPGVKCSDLDKAARDYIASKGYGKFFGHALGHGVGLEIHERPVLSGNSADKLKPGMVFTIEPGIYIPGWGGVRIEDVFVCSRIKATQISLTKKTL